jgi:ABC-2 type transport system permease protein
MNFTVVFRKELLEQWRTHKVLIVVAVLFFFGLTSPLLARYTPEMLAAIPNIPAGLSGIIPTPTVADAIGQYVKNLSQFGILLALLMSMGSVAQEKERGTAALILTRPVPRGTFLLAKFAGLALTFAVSLLLAALGCWFYTYLLFEALPWGAFLAQNGLMLLVFLVYVAMTLLCSTLVRSQAGAGGLAFGGLILLAGLGAIPRLAEYLPGQLFSWGVSLSLGAVKTAWPALWICLGLIVLFVGAAILVFQRQEL